MSDDFVAAQYDNDGTEEVIDPYGYYNELGEYIYYQTAETGQPIEQEIHTDQGIIQIQEYVINGQTILVDKDGRVVNPNKLQGEDPNQYEDYSIFVSLWQNQRISSVMDAISSSMCIWPLITPPVYLKRVDIFENLAKLCHFGTTTVAESRKIRF